MRRLSLFVLLLCLLPASHAARPAATAVATAHPLATAAGHEILAAGGNAFDAAVAVSAALAVVEPYSSGLGGGGFWLLHEAASGRDVMVDGREVAPGNAHRQMYQDDAGEVIEGASMNGPLAAGIPGEPAALAHIAEAYGQLPLARSLEPAIGYAREGFAVTPHYRRMARFRLEVLRAHPPSAQLFLHAGEVPSLGHRIRQPELARTLERLGAMGAKGFYEGPVAQRLVAAVQEAGGIWTLADLAGYEVVEREPIRFNYQGVEVVSAAPPSSGGVALAEMLQTLARFDLERVDGVTRNHLVVEAMRRAYRDRAEYLGDPDFVAMPLGRLLDPHYAAGLAASIRTDRATPSAALPGIGAAPAGMDTTHFSILDAAGNYVAATLSINYPFGSGFTAAGTGVLLNDEMDDFSAKPGVPNAYGLVGNEANAIAPGKRMLSSMSPTFLRDGERVGVLGTPGGSRIITMVLLGALEFVAGEGPEQWVSRPRFHHQYLPDTLFYEPDAFTAEALAALRRLGHNPKAMAYRFGNMQALEWRRASGQVRAAGDPRGEGQARVRPVQVPDGGMLSRQGE